MNKKLLLGAAILSIFGTTLTSCVDSTESPSVTQIREAKAAQLKSIADLNKAMAEKELILANSNKAAQEAEAALQAAQAEYLKAQAAHEQALADYWTAQAKLLDAQTEAEKAKLEKELALLQADLDAKAQDLANAKEDLKEKQDAWEITIQQLNYQLEQVKIQTLTAQHIYDQTIKAAKEAEDAAEKAALEEAARKVKELINTYNYAAQNVVTSRVALETSKMSLARLEAGLENEKNIINEDIVNLQEANKNLENDNAKQQIIIDTYSQYAGTEIEDPAQFDEARLNIVKAEVALTNYEPEATAVEEAYWEAYNNLWGSKYYELISYVLWSGDAYGTYFVTNTEIDNRTEQYWYDIYQYGLRDYNVPAECRNTYSLALWHWVGGWDSEGWDNDHQGWQSRDIYTYAPIFGTFETELATLDNGDNYLIYKSFFNLIDGGKGLKAWLDCKLTTLKNADTNLNLPTLKKDLENAQKYLTEAKKKMNAAITAYNKADGDEAAAEQKRDDAYQAYTDASDAESLAWQTYQDKWNEAWQNPTAENQEAANNAHQDYIEAQQTTSEKWSEYLELNSKYWEANTEKNNKLNDKNNAISSVDFATAWIEAITVSIRNAEGGKGDNSALVDFYTEMVNEIIEEAKTAEANLAAYNDACKVREEMLAANAELQEAVTEAMDELTSLNNAWDYNYKMIGGNATANGYVYTAKQQIEWNNAQIEENNKSIEEKKAALAKLDTSDAQLWGQYYEELLLTYTADVERNQIAYDTANKLYEIAKAELEAALEASK